MPCNVVHRYKKLMYMFIHISALPTDTVAQLVERRRDKSKVLGSNPGECHIFYLFRCVLSFSATLAMRWKVQFRLGLAINSITLILITAYQYPRNTILNKQNQLWTSIEKSTVNNKEICRSKSRHEREIAAD